MKKITNGAIYHIDFGRTVSPEISDNHLGILFKIPRVSNMVICLPLTSPKEKHFKTLIGFERRDSENLKYPSSYYIRRTDSIVLFDQLRTISIFRVKGQYINYKTNQFVYLRESDLKQLEMAFNNFFKTTLFINIDISKIDR